MTRRQWTFIGFGAAVVLVAGFALGFALSSGSPDQSPSASPSPSGPAFSCTVGIEPSTIVVNPDNGLANDVGLVLAGTGFPPNSSVSLVLIGTTLDTISDASGSVETLFAPVVGQTYPAPPDLEAGPLTWTVIGWDGALPTDSAESPPASVCDVDVTVTIEFTHAPSTTPSATAPTDLSAGDYAQVLADGVRVRATPSTGSTVVGALFTGDVVRILSPAQVVEGLVWYQVETVVLQAGGSPIRGYMAAGSDGQSYLVETTAPPPPTPTPSASPSASATP